MFFDIEIYNYQHDILKAVFEGKRKITIRSTTRAGKSFIIAISAILYAIFNNNVRVGIIAPSYDKTKPIMDYVATMLSSNNIFDQIVMVDTEGMSKLERLRKEVSKRRITFKNGSLIEIKSIDLQKKGFGVMGFGYDFVICFPYNTLINTNKGKLKIGEIVEKRKKVKVLSYNHKRKKLEFKRIKRYFKSKTVKLIELKMKENKLKCTPNHPIYVIGKGYTKASDVKEKDKVLSVGFG